MMIRSLTIAAMFFGMATSAAAEVSADQHCQQWIADTGRYQESFGSVTLSGEPMHFESDWTVPHSVMAITFADQTVILTEDNTPRSALGDYIATTLMHRERGYEAFGVISDDADGNRLGLVQPFTHKALDGATVPNCFVSAVQLSK